MSEQSGSVESEPLAEEPFLTAEAAAVVAIVLAVLSLMGQGIWTWAVQAFIGLGDRTADVTGVAVGVGAANLVVALIALWAGSRARSEPAGVTAWPDHLARAAIFLAILGVVLAVITILGALLINP